MKRPAMALVTLVSTTLYLGLAVWGEGGWAAFAAHPAVLGLVVVTYLAAVAGMLSAGSLSTGVREDRSNRWVLAAFGAVGLVSGFLPAWCDRHDLWTIAGEPVRWIGLSVYAVACVLRLAPVFVLGRRFSGLVAIQPDHKLETRGLYALVRNPSYVGALLVILGWGLTFRAWVATPLTLATLAILIPRMDSEEKLLASEFGADYEAYRRRTWRLVPWIY